MIIIATAHGRLDANGFGTALCQFCGADLPVTHPQALELIYSDLPRMHFTAVCERCWQPPTTPTPVVHPQETNRGGDREEHGCTAATSSACPASPPAGTQRDENSEQRPQTPPGPENAPEATPAAKDD